jgi:predicted transcriptional regulator
MKYAKGLLIVLLIVSVLVNIYFYSQLNKVKEYLEVQHEISTQYFYRDLYLMEMALDTVLKEQVESEPDIVKVGRNITEIKASIRQANEHLTEMKGYDDQESELAYAKITDYLFSMYFENRFQLLETAFHEQDVENLFEIAKEMEREISTVLKKLPIYDSKYRELSEEEKNGIWVDIVNQLPESETLDQFKRFISFDRISGQ